MARETKEITKKLEDKEIMQRLLKELDIPALRLSKKLGFKSHASVSHVKKGINHLSDDMIDKIVKHYPQVNYWFLKKGEEPVLINGKAAQTQANLFGSHTVEDAPDYSLEIFGTLKNIENYMKSQDQTLKRILEVLETIK